MPRNVYEESLKSCCSKLLQVIPKPDTLRQQLFHGTDNPPGHVHASSNPRRRPGMTTNREAGQNASSVKIALCWAGPFPVKHSGVFAHRQPDNDKRNEAEGWEGRVRALGG